MYSPDSHFCYIIGTPRRQCLCTCRPCHMLYWCDSWQLPATWQSVRRPPL